MQSKPKIAPVYPDINAPYDPNAEDYSELANVEIGQFRGRNYFEQIEVDRFFELAYRYYQELPDYAQEKICDGTNLPYLRGQKIYSPADIDDITRNEAKGKKKYDMIGAIKRLWNRNKELFEAKKEFVYMVAWHYRISLEPDSKEA